MTAGTAVNGEMAVIKLKGILIFDEGNNSLDVALRQAIDRYKARFGTKPTHCEVNEKQVQGTMEVQGVTVFGTKQVQPNHYFIGVEIADASH